ncbi:Gamma-glutamyl-hercynylcysteine sulfoxide hydrolase [Streptomyces sp. RB5]|uniref:Gamma-glutamyl-hercynylcysteine sulfoxide hydrolase n=1 Tax=Streptomyces smaragdinus TaxID=2585196 RepID=A0A7K0CAD9_9ACTN|nr:ergothioneine biosynthesis protein EgtC [Streptomyces smaragdinus]MQY10409.1 Gamma-glutamyl-hercynylcysteine sulfoxide hydrolase [Streptomyces smaragdinus]
MCRHIAWLGEHPRGVAELLTDPPRGLYEQSWAPRRQRHGTVNADGFGIGWYPPAGPPARYRRAVPVWADGNLPDLARTLRTTALLAAVRDATAGTSQDESAAAPYTSGPWLFSHNGAVPDWERLPADAGLPLTAERLLRLESRCDAALLWAAADGQLAAGAEPDEALARVVRDTAAVRPTARLNLLLTDGDRIAATRWGDTLWYRAGAGEVLVASEPDDAPGAPWQEVPDHSVLLATRHSVTVTPLTARVPEGSLRS